MRFLVDASLPRAATTLLKRLGHDPVDVRDIGLRSAADELIAVRAREQQEVIVTRDFDFADVRSYPPGDYAGIVVLQLPEDATASQVVRLLEAFVRRQDWLAQMPGHLAIVEVWRVRFRGA